MAQSSKSSGYTSINEIIGRLRERMEDLDEVTGLLTASLDALHLLPSNLQRKDTSHRGPTDLNLSRHAPVLQQILIIHLIPVWLPTLKANGLEPLIIQHFCPQCESQEAGEVAVHAYATILANLLTQDSIHLLGLLNARFPINRIHPVIFGKGIPSSRKKAEWEDAVRLIVMVPTKVANALQGQNLPPKNLEYGIYFDEVCSRFELLLSSLSRWKHDADTIESLSYLLQKLINVGMFPPNHSPSSPQPSFFRVNIHTIQTNLIESSNSAYADLWTSVVDDIPASSMQIFLISAFSTMPSIRKHTGLESSASARHNVVKDVDLLFGIMGGLNPGSGEVWDVLLSVILKCDWDQALGRLIVCWLSKSRHPNSSLTEFLDVIEGIWASPQQIKHSLLSRHQLLTVIFLLIVSYLPEKHEKVKELALSSQFIQGVGSYLSHLDNAIRCCGMLVGETVARLSGRSLDFGDWEGPEAHKQWARNVRKLLEQRDLDFASRDIPERAEALQGEPETLGLPSHERRPRAGLELNDGYDSDDSLVGYASPPSSGSSSPDSSELEEIEKDPTLVVGSKKILRPVYLAQLGELLRDSPGLKQSDSQQEADKIEVALNCGEELIKRKEHFGSELDENAANLAIAFVGLQNNFELDNFDEKRQRALTALVVCCPKISGPCVIEQLFTSQYSVNQRFAILNALSLGARELANATPDHTQIPFPSKLLPPALHNELIGQSPRTTNVIPHITNAVVRETINADQAMSSSSKSVPARERRMRIRSSTKVSEVNGASTSTVSSRSDYPARQPFITLAAEYFILPLINRFWSFLQDEQSRESRSARMESRSRYHAGGSGLVLNPIILSRLLGCLTILIHASKNAPEWLSTVAPDGLEIAVTVGSKPISMLDVRGEDIDECGDNSSETEASVLTACLELALIVVDGCISWDGGRTVSLEHTALLLATREWAKIVFERISKGITFVGGGSQESRLQRSCSNLLLKVEDVLSKWGRSMIDTT